MRFLTATSIAAAPVMMSIMETTRKTRVAASTPRNWPKCWNDDIHREIRGQEPDYVVELCCGMLWPIHEQVHSGQMIWVIRYPWHVEDEERCQGQQHNQQMKDGVFIKIPDKYHLRKMFLYGSALTEANPK